MMCYQYSFSCVEIEQLNGILANIVSGAINSIVSEMIGIGLEYAIKYIRKNAVQLLTTILFLYTVYRIKLLPLYSVLSKRSRSKGHY
ncbi:MAG: hypothetical protein RR639_07010 [Hydrogenoanaerobacterium sp.]